MIQINDLSNQQIVRQIPHMIEPLIVAQIKKAHHTYFVYRCSDYNDLFRLAKCHGFDLNNISNIIAVINRYWSAIDIIKFEILEQPEFACNKTYFDRLRELCLEPKTVTEMYLYEVKLSRGLKKPVLSVRTHNCMMALEKYGKKMSFIEVNLKGSFALNYQIHNIKDFDFKIRTHYGREGKYISRKSFSKGDHGSKTN